ncbi:Alpha-(1,3)-fucosyltransferase C [Holothuria leucospilota]|uniref:Fucosyltransferase n=1 Tax=Holothuria leucospilota TaxID=206669 RepID=A0A9Q1CE97_HOLLE|nr:Alpha-(1,3)-fucosyltransferase C [Holothuria leucospilota]
MEPRRKLVLTFTWVATFVLLAMSFSFTLHYNNVRYNRIKVDAILFKDSRDIIRGLPNKARSNESKHASPQAQSSVRNKESVASPDNLRRRNTGHIDIAKIDNGLSVHGKGKTVEDYVLNAGRKHFILNDTINPVYDKSGRCVIRVLMFMLQKMIRRIGKYEGTYHCPELQCDYEITYSTKYEALANKHIVILFLRTKWEWADLHAARPPNQIWVMYARESPRYDHCIVPEDQWYNTSYNWTMTFHEDAHFSVPYGRYIPGVPTVPTNDSRNWAEGKDKLAAWMASNCEIASYPRYHLIKKLSKRFSLDTFGKCGTKKCPKNDPETCNKILSHYKFYFALENAECGQYITEKLWRNAYTLDLVPIVFGAPKADYERLAPPNSFIYLGDFTSHLQLTQYLQKIDRNDTLYNKFFEWKKHGSVEVINFQTIFSDASVCKLIAKYLLVRQKDPADVPDIMPDLMTWWKNTCYDNKNVTQLIRSM